MKQRKRQRSECEWFPWRRLTDWNSVVQFRPSHLVCLLRTEPELCTNTGFVLSSHVQSGQLADPSPNWQKVHWIKTADYTFKMIQETWDACRTHERLGIRRMSDKRLQSLCLAQHTCPLCKSLDLCSPRRTEQFFIFIDEHLFNRMPLGICLWCRRGPNSQSNLAWRSQRL